jgi:hypothetical protein
MSRQKSTFKRSQMPFQTGSKPVESSRRSRSLLPVAALACLGVASSAHASLTNGNFATGDFTGWTTTGIASVETASSIGEPTTGGDAHQALIQTSTLTGNPVAVAAIDTFLGTTPTLTNSANDFLSGSAFKQTFTAAAGSTLSFDYNFLTDQATDGTGEPDEAFAFLLFNGATASNNPDLGEPFNAIKLANASDTTFKNESGYTTYVFGSQYFNVAGSYTLGFAVLNGSAVSDIVISDARTFPPDTGLLVDNVNLASGGVPEPTTLALMAMASAGLLLRGRRQPMQENPARI